MHIHLARWIVTPERPPIENGGIVTFGGKIVAVDSASTLRSHYHGTVTDHGDAIICPPLVNAHCHLELSQLDYKLKPASPGPGSFTSWVKTLIALREKEDANRWGSAIEDAVFQLLDNGVAVLGDVGNTKRVPLFIERAGRMWPFLGIFFQEIISPLKNGTPIDLPLHKEGTKPVAERLSDQSVWPFYRAISAHAPYTVAPSKIREIDQWNRKRGLPFAIHLAESADEIEFMRHGTGALKELMESKGHYPPDWEIPGMSPVKYIDVLGCLHDRTLCIHCVHVDDDDITLLSRRRASVCLCPRSNRFIGVGKAPAYAMYRAGINLALGTDSLASNRRLSIFSEMAELSHTSPDMPHRAIFQAATIGGAKALGLQHLTGSIEPGKAALFLVIQARCKTLDKTFETLVNQAHNGSIHITFVED